MKMNDKIITRDDAINKGLKRYFTGKPCPHGHVAERYVASFGCADCCRKKSQEANKKFYLKNKEKIKTQSKKNYKKNRDSCLSDRKEYRKLNSDKIKERERAHYEKNKEKILERNRNYWKENSHLFKDKRAKYLKNNPIRVSVYHANRKARKLGNGGTHTNKQAMFVLNAQKNKCANCKCKLTENNRHKDHIIPLVLGGTNDIINIQWLCAPCNLSKGAKDPIIWAQKHGRLF